MAEKENSPSLLSSVTVGRYLPRLLLFVFLITGIFIYKDYGLSWDEIFSLNDTGLSAWNYVFNDEAESYLNNSEKYHGPSFEMTLILFQKIFSLTDSRDVFLMRHLVTFLLFWLSGVTFYLLIKENYNNAFLSVAAICFYFLMPRIFADSFYNSKDIAFLSMFTIGLYTMFRFADKPSIFNAVLHGFVCGYTTGIRIMGILIPLLTLFLILWRGALLKKYKSDRVILFISLLFVMACLLSTILFWPVLWLGPIHHFHQAWIEMSRFNWDRSILFNGNLTPASVLPWYYSLTWIAITTPLQYLFLILIAILFLIRKSFNSIMNSLMVYEKDFTALSLIMIPLVSIIFLHSVIYDGWRHIYFIYGPMCFLSVRGLYELIRLLKIETKLVYRTIVMGAIFIPVATNMIGTHPYQNVYFNVIPHLQKGPVGERYELDYWGLSYRRALEKLAAKDTSKTIRLDVANPPGIMNSWILEPETRNRLKYVTQGEGAEYYITNFRWDKDIPFKFHKTDSILVDKVEISATYKRF